MTELHEAVEQAVSTAIREINEQNESGRLPVDAHGDRDFVREMSLIHLDAETVDDWHDWDELDGLLDRVIERQLE